MGRKNNHTDQAFKESLKQFQAVPPEGVWEGITETLNADRRKVRMAWMGRIAAAAVIVIAAGTAWIWVQRSASNEIGRVEVIEKQEVSEELPQETPMETTQDVHAEVSDGPAGDLASGLSADTPEGISGDSPDGILPDASGGLAGDVQDGLMADANSGQSPGEEPGLEAHAGAGGVDRINGINGISKFLIPVEDSGEGTLLAVYTGGDGSGLQMDRQSDEETESGIDVFEEFGEEKSLNYSKWAVGGQVTPLYSYRNVESASYDYASAVTPTYSGYSSANTYSGSYNDFESGMLSFAGGVNVNYSPAKRLSLQSGIYYSRMGMSITNGYIASLDGQEQWVAPDFSQMEQVANSTGQINQGDPFKNNAVVSNIAPPVDMLDTETRVDAGPLPSPEIVEGDVLQQFEYIEVPLIARYRVVDRRLGMNLLGGLSTNFLVGNKVYFQEGANKEYIGTTEDIKSINYSSVLGLGFQYSLSKKLLINLEPTFRYYLNSVNTGSGPGSHPYSLGFFTGISYSF